MKMTKKLTAVGTALTIGCLPAITLANGYHFLHQSAEGAGSAYSTNGTAINDISAMFSNPSSIIRFDGTRATGAFTIDLPSSQLTNANATAPFSDGTVAVEGTPETPDQPIDTAFGAASYLTHQLRNDLVLGLSITAPYAYVSEYPETAVSRYTATETALQAPNISPTLAYRINDQWAIGGSINYQYYLATLGTSVATSVNNPSVETDIQSEIKGSDGAFGFSLGFEFQPTDSTRIGVSYRSRIDHDFDGELRLSGSETNFNALRSLAASNGVNITSRNGSANFEVSTPSMFQVGLLQKLSQRSELYANANLTGWSAFKDTVVTYDNGFADTVVDNDWDDSWFAALGFGYQYSDKIKLRTGAAYDWTPTPAEVVSPRAPNNDRWNVGFGLSYQKSKKLKLDFGYQYIKFTEVTIALQGGNNIPRGTLNANLDLDAHIFMTQVNYQF